MDRGRGRPPRRARMMPRIFWRACAPGADRFAAGQGSERPLRTRRRRTTAPHRPRGQGGRLPADPRATAHDRHAGRARRAHGARAALGDGREIEAALAERGGWIVRTLAEWRTRRRDVLPREWKTGAPILYRGPRARARAVSRRAGRRSRHDLLDLTVLHPAAARRSRASPRSSATGCGTRRCARWCRGSRPVAARITDRRRGQAVERPQRMGKLQPRGEIRPQLAARAAAAATRRLRRRARGRASRRAQPLAALLGAGRDAVPGPRGGAARARRMDGAARAVTDLCSARDSRRDRSLFDRRRRESRQRNRQAAPAPAEAPPSAAASSRRCACRATRRRAAK